MPQLLSLVFTRRSLPIFLVVVVSLVVACGDGGDSKSVTGDIVDVQARTITEFESLTVIDEDGRTWEFKGGLFAGFTPSHLREHQALGDPVKVWFVEDGVDLRVTRIEDG